MTNNVKGFIISTVLMACVLVFLVSISGVSESEVEAMGTLYRSMGLETEGDNSESDRADDQIIDDILPEIHGLESQGDGSVQQEGEDDDDVLINTIYDYINQTYPEQ